MDRSHFSSDTRPPGDLSKKQPQNGIKSGYLNYAKLRRNSNAGSSINELLSLLDTKIAAAELETFSDISTGKKRNTSQIHQYTSNRYMSNKFSTEKNGMYSKLTYRSTKSANSDLKPTNTLAKDVGFNDADCYSFVQRNETTRIIRRENMDTNKFRTSSEFCQSLPKSFCTTSNTIEELTNKLKQDSIELSNDIKEENNGTSSARSYFSKQESRKRVASSSPLARETTFVVSPVRHLKDLKREWWPENASEIPTRLPTRKRNNSYSISSAHFPPNYEPVSHKVKVVANAKGEVPSLQYLIPKVQTRSDVKNNFSPSISCSTPEANLLCNASRAQVDKLKKKKKSIDSAMLHCGKTKSSTAYANMQSFISVKKVGLIDKEDSITKSEYEKLSAMGDASHPSNYNPFMDGTDRNLMERSNGSICKDSTSSRDVRLREILDSSMEEISTISQPDLICFDDSSKSTVDSKCHTSLYPETEKFTHLNRNLISSNAINTEMSKKRSSKEILTSPKKNKTISKYQHNINNISSPINVPSKNLSNIRKKKSLEKKLVSIAKSDDQIKNRLSKVSLRIDSKRDIYESDSFNEENGKRLKSDVMVPDAFDILVEVDSMLALNRKMENEILMHYSDFALPRSFDRSETIEVLKESIARCREFTSKSGYSRESIVKVNNLLTDVALDLRDAVQRERELLKQQGELCTKYPANGFSHRKSENLANFEKSFQGSQNNEIGTLVLNIHVLTNKIKENNFGEDENPFRTPTSSRTNAISDNELSQSFSLNNHSKTNNYKPPITRIGHLTNTQSCCSSRISKKMSNMDARTSLHKVKEIDVKENVLQISNNNSESVKHSMDALSAFQENDDHNNQPVSSSLSTSIPLSSSGKPVWRPAGNGQSANSTAKMTPMKQALAEKHIDVYKSTRDRVSNISAPADNSQKSLKNTKKNLNVDSRYDLHNYRNLRGVRYQQKIENSTSNDSSSSFYKSHKSTLNDKSNSKIYKFRDGYTNINNEKNAFQVIFEKRTKEIHNNCKKVNNDGYSNRADIVNTKIVSKKLKWAQMLKNVNTTISNAKTSLIENGFYKSSQTNLVKSGIPLKYFKSITKTDSNLITSQTSNESNQITTLTLSNNLEINGDMKNTIKNDDDPSRKPRSFLPTSSVTSNNNTHESNFLVARNKIYNITSYKKSLEKHSESLKLLRDILQHEGIGFESTEFSKLDVSSKPKLNVENVECKDIVTVPSRNTIPDSNCDPSSEVDDSEKVSIASDRLSTTSNQFHGYFDKFELNKGIPMMFAYSICCIPEKISMLNIPKASQINFMSITNIAAESIDLIGNANQKFLLEKMEDFKGIKEPVGLSIEEVENITDLTPITYLPENRKLQDLVTSEQVRIGSKNIRNKTQQNMSVEVMLPYKFASSHDIEVQLPLTIFNSKSVETEFHRLLENKFTSTIWNKYESSSQTLSENFSSTLINATGCAVYVHINSKISKHLIDVASQMSKASISPKHFIDNWTDCCASRRRITMNYPEPQESFSSRLKWPEKSWMQTNNSKGDFPILSSNFDNWSKSSVSSYSSTALIPAATKYSTNISGSALLCHEKSSIKALQSPMKQIETIYESIVLQRQSLSNDVVTALKDRQFCHENLFGYYVPEKSMQMPKTDSNLIGKMEKDLPNPQINNIFINARSDIITAHLVHKLKKTGKRINLVTYSSEESKRKRYDITTRSYQINRTKDHIRDLECGRHISISLLRKEILFIIIYSMFCWCVYWCIQMSVTCES